MSNFNVGRAARRGFTLLELIVVITIIGILGTMVVVKMTGWTAKARIAKIKHDLKAIVHAAELIKAETGQVPQTLEEIKSGKIADTGGTGGDSTSGISVENTKDPYNNDYGYEVSSDGNPRAFCLGRDGAPGGEGDNKDYHEPEEEGM